MNIILESDIFHQWLRSLRDIEARHRIVARIKRAAYGNFGDAKPVGDGVQEMRIAHGPGYRVYYARKGEIVYLLLCGGDKRTQQKDISLAKTLWAEERNRNGEI